jgi:DNA-binding transcriptional MocR family regulator
MKGCAKRVYALAKEAGVTLTPAGAPYPYGIDPEDENLRIAPSFPPVSELREAVEVLCLCVKLAAVEKLIALNGECCK